MNQRGLALALLIGVVTPVLEASDLAPEVLLLARIKAATREALSGIPAYVCSENVGRFSRRASSLRFNQIDGFEVQVAQIGQRELFARPGDKEFQDKPLSEMVHSGMVATGLFYVMADAVFSSSATVFKYHGTERRAHRRAVRYDYRIAQIFSTYRIQSNGYEAAVGMEGSFWADPNSLDLLELVVHGTDIPPQLHMKSAVTTITYNSAKIAGERKYLIPATAIITSTSAGGIEDQNRTEFRSCRKYTGEATITFD